MKKRTISEQAATIPIRRLPGFEDLPFTGGQLREAIIYKMIQDLLRPEVKDPEQLQEACDAVFKKVMGRSAEFDKKSPSTIVNEEIDSFLGPGSAFRSGMGPLTSKISGPDDK